jgi:hypothetical protein
VIGSLDNSMTLGDVIDTTARRLGLEDEEVDTLRDESLEVIRELLELGALGLRQNER